MHRKTLAVGLSLALLVSSTGCSMMFMTKAPDPVIVPNYPVECTSSSAAPILDTICGGYFIANTIVIAGMKSCSEAAPGETCTDAKGGGMALSGGLAALCTVSAIGGYGKASKCQAVKNQNALCITGNADACRSLNASWKPPPQQPGPAPTPDLRPASQQPAPAQPPVQQPAPSPSPAPGQ